MSKVISEYPIVRVGWYEEEGYLFMKVNCYCGEEWLMGKKISLTEQMETILQPHWLNDCKARKDYLNV